IFGSNGTKTRARRLLSCIGLGSLRPVLLWPSLDVLGLFATLTIGKAKEREANAPSPITGNSLDYRNTARAGLRRHSHCLRAPTCGSCTPQSTREVFARASASSNLGICERGQGDCPVLEDRGD